MAWENCGSCGKEVFLKSRETLCPDCKNQGVVLESKVRESETKESLGSQAVEQANVLNRFGQVMQGIGYFVMGVYALASIIALFSSQWILFAISLVLIPIAFVLFNVVGSAVRAISLYIQFKVKKT
jgi:hypothetical protein